MVGGGVQFGGYELLGRLGAGGMAETFVALRRHPHGVTHRVCLKRILPAFSADPDFRQLFLEEACVSARLRHSGVAQVMDFGQVDDTYFLALELIEGTDLRGLVRALREEQRTLPPELVVHLALELGKTLDFAHANDAGGRPRGVVHRDISPANILLSLRGEVKLTDFGVAKAVRHATLTRTRSVKGKLPYMAPEYAKEGRYDARSDLFSLGVTLYEALTGSRPFDAATELATLQRLESGDFVPILERVPDAPKELADAIERLLQPDPSNRFPSGDALVQALLPIAPSPLAQARLGALVRTHARRPVLLGTPTPSPEPPTGPSLTLHLPGELAESTRMAARQAGPHDPTRTRLDRGPTPVALERPARSAGGRPAHPLERPAHGAEGRPAHPLARGLERPWRIAALVLAGLGLVSAGALYGAWLAGG